MVFSSAIFLFFFLPLVLLSYLAARTMACRNALLIVASLLFYAFGEPVYVFLLVFSVFANYLFARLIASWRGSGTTRRFVLAACVAGNVMLLGVFKYAGGSITMPVGISFFTFQALSYVIDVYRDAGRVKRNFADVLLYISFFPQLVAGPIVRWGEMEPQLYERTVDAAGLADGICRFVKGLAKKLLLANGLGSFADIVFGLEIERYGATVAWLGAVCYALQIYYDFSGYSDMAIGLAAMFGFHFEENFRHPYSSGSIHEFWRRWHISLSRWFREYVYIPLGGSRKGFWRAECNKMIVFLLTGIWHGASPTFVFWGIYHGVLNILEDVCVRFFARGNQQEGGQSQVSATEEGKLVFGRIGDVVGKGIGNISTLVLVVIGFVFFRAESLAYAVRMLKTMFAGFSVSVLSMRLLAEQITPYLIVLLILAIVFSYPVSQLLRERAGRFLSKEGQQGTVGRRMFLFDGIVYAGTLVLFVLCVCSLACDGYNPFIYFRF